MIFLIAGEGVTVANSDVTGRGGLSTFVAINKH